MLSNGGYRAYFLSSTQTAVNNPYPTLGSVKVYVKAGETLYLGSSAQGIGKGKIIARTPNGVVYNSGNSTTIGRINNIGEEQAGPLPNTGGYTPYKLLVKSNEEGVWDINFISPDSTKGQSTNMPPVKSATSAWTQSSDNAYISAFDVTVKNSLDEVKNGRAYVNVFGGCLGDFNIGFNAIFHVLTKDGYIYKVNNNGQAGYVFAFFVNNKGFKDNAGSALYKSVSSTSAPTHDPRSADTGTDITHKIFFSKPSSDLPLSAPMAGGSTTWLLREPASPSASNFLFTGTEGTLYKGGTFPLGGYITFDADQAISYVVSLDLNKNGVFNEASDKVLRGISKIGSNSVFWNGKDSSGTAVVGNLSFKPEDIKVVLRGGEVHFPFTDVEANFNGIIITRINGVGSDDDKIYWDDSNITKYTPYVKVQTLGSSSTTAGHKWGEANNYKEGSFGDEVGIDTWAYVESSPINPLMNVELQKADLQVSSITTSKNTYCVGEEITYNVKIKNSGPSSVTGAKFVLSYPAGFQFTGVTAVQTTGVSSNYGNASSSSQFSTTVDMANGAEMTLQIKGKATLSGTLGSVVASILRPADVTDPDATNADSAVPTDAAAECSVGCNNIKTAATLTINTVGISIFDASVTEKTSALSEISFNVSIPATSLCDISATYSITHGTTNAADFDSSVSGTGTVTIPAGSKTATVKFLLNADKIIEANETFDITLSNVIGGYAAKPNATGTIVNDDSADLTITSTAGDETGTVAGKYIFSLSNVSDAPTELDYALSGDATAGADFTGSATGTIIIPAGSSTYTLNIPVIDDDIVEGDEVAKLSLTRLFTIRTGTITNKTTTSPEVKISDNDNATLTLSSDVVLNEGPDNTVNATFTLTLNKQTSKKFTLNYRSDDLTATVADNDYVPTGTVSLEFNGSKNESKTITIPVVGDRKIEGDENIKLSVFNLSDSFGNRLTIPKDVGNVTITNDDLGQVSIVSDNAEEGVKSGTFTFKLPLGVTADLPLTITYSLTGDAMGGGNDYVSAVTGTVTIPAGQNSVTLVLPVIDDAIAEGPEDVVIAASIAANPYNITLANSSQLFTIVDNDKALLSISPASVTEGNSGTKTINFDVTLNVATAGDFYVGFKTADGTASSSEGDYVAKAAGSETLHFDGTAGQKLPISITVNADLKIEGDETFSVLLDDPTVNFGNNLSLLTSSATGTILDDDSGVISVTASNGSENGPQNAGFVFSFPAGVSADKPTRIKFEFDGDATSGSDFLPSASSYVDIPAGATSIPLTLAVDDDMLVEGQETLKLKNVSIISDYSRVSLNSSIPQVSIEDNDAATLTLSGPASLNETSSGTTTATFTVKLDKPVSKPFSIAYNTENGTAATGDNDYVANTGILSFNGTAGQSWPISVVINGDKKVEADENFLLKLSALSNNFGGKLSIPVTQANCLIKNDDNAQVVLSAAPGAEGMYDASVTFTLSNGASADKATIIDYTLTGSAISGSDYSLSVAGAATIPAGSTSVTVPIPVIDDAILEYTEDIKIAASVRSGAYNFTVQNSPISLDILDNDNATITIASPIAIIEGNAGTVNIEFEVKLSKESSKSLTLKYKTTDDTAIAGSDYIGQSSGTINFPPTLAGTTQKISIPVTGDFLIEGDESFKVTLSDLSDNFGGQITLPDPVAIGRILNDDGGDIKITHKDGKEAGQTPEFIFSFPAGYSSAQPIVINYTLQGSAVSGVDFTGASGSVTIPAGTGSTSLTLNVVDDAIVEGDEAIELNVTFVSNGLAMVNTFEKLTIADNDNAIVSLNGPVTITETNSGTTIATFSVTVDKQTSKSFSIGYATADGTGKVNDNDYLPANGSISFNGSQAGVPQTFTVLVNGDTKIEKDETFTVDLLTISDTFKDNTGTDHLSFGTKKATGTIKNDDSASILITSDGGKEGVKGASFLFSLSQGSADEDIKISYNLTGDAVGVGTDYQGATTGEVIIPAGLSSVTLNLPVVDDAILEDAENIVLNANIVSSSYPVNFTNTTETAAITDNDQALVTLTGVTITEGDDGVKTASFSLRLDNKTSKIFKIDYTTTDGTATIADADYVAQTGQLQFAGNAGEVQTVDVVINGDRKLESDEELGLLLSNLSYNFDNRLSISALTAKATILNNDAADITITSTNGKEAGPVPATFEFSYQSGFSSDKDVVIQYTLSGLATSGDDFTPATTASITIPAGQSKATLTLPVIDDQVVESSEDLKLSVSSISSGNTVTMADQSKSLTIEDNDEATLSLSSDVTITEGNSGQTTANFTITLDKKVSSGFTLGYATADVLAKTSDNDYIASGGTLTFSGNANETKTISVPVNGDTKIEADETFKFNLGALVSSFNSLFKIPVTSRTATIKNDDVSSLVISKADGKEGAKDASFTIGFEPGITADVPVKIDYFLNGNATSNVDYTGGNGLIEIPAGQNSVTVNLPVIDDIKVEDLESLLITASARSNTYAIAVSNSPQTPFIEDNDKAQISISPVTLLEGDNGTQKAVFKVKLTGTTASGFSLKYKTVDGTATSADGDFVATAAGTLTFAGTANEVQEIKIDINADRKIESDETFSVVLDDPQVTYGNTLTLANSSATATIQNDDSGVIEVTATDFREDNPSGAGFKFSFPAGVSSDKVTRINFKLDGDAEATKDYTFSGQDWVEIPAGQESVTLSLPVVDDVIVEEEEKVKIKDIALAVSTNLISLSATSLEVPVIDNDAATLTLSGPVTLTETSTGQITATFPVKLDKAVSKLFSIAYTTQDGLATTADNDYVAASGTLTFNGTAGESQDITVIINGDKKVEADENFLLKLSSLSNAFGGRLTVPTTELTPVIKNDDSAEIVITKADGAEGMYNASLTFGLSNGASSDKITTIDYTLSGTAISGSDYTLAVTGSATIAAGQNSVTVNIPVTDDDIVESTETIQASFTANSAYGFTVQNSAVSMDILDNDKATITLVGPVSVNEGDAGTTNLEFDVKLNKELSSTITLKYKTTDGTALAGSDYVAKTGTLSFKTAGQTEKISIPVTGDLSIEQDETIKVSLFDLSDNISGKLTLVDPEVTGLILNDDGGDITITHKDGAEAGDTPEFTFSLPTGITSAQPTIIQYKLEGKAVSGTDFTGASTSITIPAGDNSVSLKLPVVDDAIVEMDEDVELTVTSVDNGRVMANTFQRLNIADNDIATLSLSGPVVTTEANTGTTTATFTVTLDKETSKGFSIDYATADGTAKVSDNDYLPASTSLSFNGTAAGETKSFAVVINGDTKIEKDETFKVELSNISETFKDKSGADHLSFDSKISTGTIKNDDSASILIAGESGTEGVKGGRFTFSLSQGTVDEDVKVSYNLTGDATGAGTDYQGATTGTVIIPTGQTSVVLELPVVDDALLEDTESIVLNANSVISSYAIALSNSTETITVTDNDQAVLTLNGLSITEGDDGVKTATFSVSLDKGTSKGFKVDYATVDGTATSVDADYVAKSDKLQFAGNAGEVQTVEVVINGDRKIESDEMFSLLLSNLSYNYSNRLTWAAASAKATILNNDQSEIFITSSNGKEAGPVSASFEFSYKPGYSSDKNAVIQYSLSGAAVSGTDYTGSASSSLTILAGQTKATLTLPVTDDQVVEDREEVKLTVSSVNSDNATSITDKVKSLDIEDNDEATLTLSNDVTITEGSSGQKMANFTISLDKETSSGFTLAYATADQTAKTSDNDYIANNGTLTFSGTAGESKTVSVAINGDLKIEADEMFSFNLGTLVSAFDSRFKVPVMSKTATITNDDSGNLTVTKIDGEEGVKDASFTIGFESGLTADVPLRIEYFLGGEAKSNADYSGNNSYIDIPAGQNNVSVSLPVIDDAVVEDIEKIELELKVQTNTHGISIPATVTNISIADNDAGKLSISAAAIKESEAGSQTLNFNVKLDKATAKPFTVAFSTADGTATSSTGDYTSLSETLSFAGLAGEVQTIKVVVKDDKIVEATENITAKLNSISNTFNSRLAFDAATATGTISDDDFGIIQVTKVDGAEGSSAAAKFIFTFKDNVTSDKATSIAYNLAGLAGGNGLDYTTATSGSVSIAAGQNSVTLSLPVVDDDKVEGTEDVKIINAICTSPYVAVTLDAIYPEISIADNDNGVLSLSSDVVLTEGNNGTQNASYTLTLNKATNTGFEIAYLTADGTALSSDDDYLPAFGTLTFAGTAGESKTISIVVKGDQKIEAAELFGLEIKDPSLNFGGLLSIPEKKRTTKIENDDSGTITITKVNGVEGGQAGSFIFGYPTGVIADIPVKIDYSLSGTAKGNNVDYVGSSPASVTIPAGQSNVTLNLPVNDDELVEDTETVGIAASAASNAYAINLANATETLDILDNDNAKILIEPASVVEGDAGISNLNFKLTLKKATGKSFTIGYETADGTAKITDGDYTAVAANSTVSFAGTAGENQIITVQVKGDRKIEADETLSVILKSLSDNFNGRLLLENTSATGTILNNDLGLLSITKTDGAEAGAVGGSFIFSLPAGMTSDQPTVINYSLSGTAGGNGVDYVGVTTASVTIPAEQNSITLSLPVNNDVIVEDDETVQIAVNSLYSANGAFISLNNTMPVMKIMDDDFGDIAVGAPVVKAEGNGGTTAFEFPVTLTKATGLPFTIKYSTANGTATIADDDYIAAVDQVLDFAGLAGEIQTIKIQVKGDLKLEADELFNLAIHSLSQKFGNRLQIATPSSTGTIKNDDTGFITVTKTDGTEGLQDAAFTFSFPQGVTSEAATVINYRLSGTATGADYTAAGVSSIIIPAGANRVTLPVKVVDDNELEEVETVIIAITSISNANSVLTWEVPLPVAGITDNDRADVSITGPAPTIEKHNGKTSATFSVKLDNVTSKGFELDFGTTNGSASTDDKDFDAKTGRLAFSGYAGETKQITVDINGDLKVEGDELFNVLLSNITPSFGGRLTSKTPQASAQIINDDFAPVANPDMITTSEDTPVTFSIIANDTDADGINASTISIQNQPVKGTLKVNANGTVNYIPLANDYGTYTFTYTVKDNLGLVSNLATATISVVPVNDPPLAGDDKFFVTKDVTFRGTVATNDSDVDGDVLKFRLLTFPAKATLDNFNTFDGTFIYRPKPGFAGVDIFTYEITDPDGLKDTARVTLNVQGNVIVSLSPKTAVITEGDTVIVHAQINDVLLEDVQITLKYGGTATAGKDYIIQPQYITLTIPAGTKVSKERLVVQSLKDYLREGTEQISIRIVSASPAGFVSIGNSTDITINDLYPEGKPAEPGANNDIVPDPLLSPNGDQIGNEKFVIRNIENYPDNEVVLFNRWGNEVYRVKGYNNEDKAFVGVANSGIVSNTKAPLADGVYYYIIQTRTLEGVLKNKGYVILKR